MMAVDEQILALGRRLRLPVIANYREYLPDTTQHPFPETLLHLLQTEVAGREERSFARRLKDCRFPELKTLDTFQSGLLPYLSTAQVQELATCNYIRNRNNVLGVGNSGTGKTHLCIALGIEAIRQGFSVRFHMVMPLLDQLVEARDNRELRQQMRPLESCDLLILDEFGYQRLSQPQASILFQLFASRHERRSTYVTTNLEFSKWADILNEAMLTAALVDRFAHKSILLNMNEVSRKPCSPGPERVRPARLSRFPST